MAKEKAKKIKAIESESTIVLKYDGQIVNVQKKSQKTLFNRLSKMIKLGNEEELIKEFGKAAKLINDYAGKDFSVQNGVLKLKGTDEVLPKCIASKLQQLHKEKVDYSPLIKFWEKLKHNPSEDSRNELYGFMLHNNIGLTEDGDIVVLKGVKQSGNKLVDCHTGRIDNSVGMIVEMPRNQVNANRNQTCSHGLHVAAGDYVNNFYSSGIIIECIVDPADVVSVPTDYNNKKMRVCKYFVAGYADKSQKKPTIRDKADLLSGSTIPKLDNLPKPQVDKSGGYKVISKQIDLKELLSKMTSKEINQYTFNQTGKWVLDPKDEKFTSRIKNKKKITKDATEILVKFTTEKEKLQENVETTKKSKGITTKNPKDIKTEKGVPTDEFEKTDEGGSVYFTGLKARQIVQQIEVDFGEKIGGKIPKRAQVIKKAISMYAERDITVID